MLIRTLTSWMLAFGLILGAGSFVGCTEEQQDDVEFINRLMREAGHAVHCRWVARRGGGGY